MNSITRLAATCSLDQLTQKEREVAHHLAQHKSSKQIGYELGVTENTVNKHVAAIRSKWSTRDRFETARLYLVLISEGDEIHPPQILPGDDTASFPSDDLSDLPRSADFQLSDVIAMRSFDHFEVPAPKGLEALDSRFGKAWRIIAIPVLALLIGMVLIWSLAFAKELTDLF